MLPTTTPLGFKPNPFFARRPRYYATATLAHPAEHAAKAVQRGPRGSGLLTFIGIVLVVGVPIYSTLMSERGKIGNRFDHRDHRVAEIKKRIDQELN